MLLMTIVYPGGAAVEALLLSSGPGSLKVAVAGRHRVRRFELVDGTWMSEAGRPVQIHYAGQQDQVRIPAESDFVCPRRVGRQVISNLMSGESGDRGNPFYVFAPEDNRVRITVLR